MFAGPHWSLGLGNSASKGEFRHLSWNLACRLLGRCPRAGAEQAAFTPTAGF